MSTIKIKSINTEDLEKETSVTTLTTQANAVVITGQQDLDVAGQLLIEVKRRYKELDSQRKTITNPIDAAKKAVMDLFRNPLLQLEKAESVIKNAIIKYDDEQKEIARKQQLELQKLADQEAERQKKLLDAKIQRAEASGKVEKAEELAIQKEMIVPIAAPVVTPTIEQPAGVSYKTIWSAEVTDISQVPREYMIANLPSLNKIAQATKGSISIPGVKFIATKILASRS